MTIRLDHKPAEKAQIDFCDGLSITDPATGHKTLTQFFLGELPFSSYFFGKFVADQKLATFIGVQSRMFAYFGGVTPYVVVDNLKSGVNRADLYDPDVNATYCDFANYMGFAVLPARPRKPRDKGSGETHIGVVQRGFFQEVRNRLFYSLPELNQTLRDYLERLNHEVMKDYGMPHPALCGGEKAVKTPAAYSLRVKRVAASQSPSRLPHPGGEKLLLSPFCLRWTKVRVRLTDKIVEVFSADSKPLTAHPRLRGIGQFSTYDFPYPEKKLSVVRFELRHAQAQAKQLGPHVEK